MASDSLNVVINKIHDTVQDSLMNDRRRQSEREDAIFDSLFELELNNQQTYKQELIKAGLSLPEAEQSSNFSVFADNAGDTVGLTNMANNYATLKEENELAENMLTEYFAGQKFGGIARGAGYATTGEEFGTVAGEMFNEEEMTAAIGFGIDTGQISSKEGVSEAFKLGMQINEYDALKNIEIKNKIYATNQELKNKNIDRALAQHNSLTADIGTEVLINVGGSLGEPIEAMAGSLALTDEDQRETALENYDEVISRIKSNKNISNISQELISAITSYSSVNQDVSEFQELAAKAYDLAAKNTNKENQYISEVGGTREEAKAALMASDTTYSNNSMLLTEYGIAGIISENELMTQAFLVEKLGGDIKEASITDSMNMLKGFSPMPTFEQITDEYNLIEGLDANLSEYNVVNNIYGNVFGDDNSVLGLDNDLVKLASEFATAEEEQNTAMNNFRDAGLDLENLLTGGNYKGFVGFPAQADMLPSEVALGTSTRHPFFKSANYALPDENEIRNLKAQVEQGLVQMQAIDYGTFGRATGRPGRNIDVQVRAKEIWDNYIASWKAAKDAKGEFVRIDDLIFGK